MTSENNCIIEDVDNTCVEMPSDEIGVKEHDNFCDEPYDDSFDHNCGDAYIENVVGNVDCVVDNVHANPLENVGNINARRDDDICDNSSNACKNATYDLHDRAFMCGNEFWVTNEVIFLTPCDFNDNDSFDSSDDDENCFDTCENNSFNSMENNSIESCVDNFSNSYDSNSSNPCENNSSVSLEDNDGLESFTFDDNALINENDDKLHEIVCGDDNVHDDANMCELNDVEFVNFFDDCIDDAMYVHEFLGEVEEEMNGSEGDVLLNSEKERENEKQEIMVEGVENENVKEEVEDKNKTSDESVREEVEEKFHVSCYVRIYNTYRSDLCWQTCTINDQLNKEVEKEIKRSIVVLRQEQVDDIAHGFVNCSVQFLWSMKPPNKDSAFKPVEFIHGSAHQRNSGRPLPAMGRSSHDEVTNAKYLVDVFWTGIRLCRGEAEDKIIPIEDIDKMWW
nr:hypothetical protein Itr_chr15CG15360 [Ipomoea trifida]